MESEGQRPGLGHYWIGVVEIEDQDTAFGEAQQPRWSLVTRLRMSTLPHASVKQLQLFIIL